MGKDDKARQTSQGEASVDVIKATAAAASAAVAFPAFCNFLGAPVFPNQQHQRPLEKSGLWHWGRHLLVQTSTVRSLSVYLVAY